MNDMVQNNKPCKTQNNEHVKFNGGEYNVLTNNLVVLCHYSFVFELFSLVVKRKKKIMIYHMGTFNFEPPCFDWNIRLNYWFFRAERL